MHSTASRNSAGTQISAIFYVYRGVSQLSSKKVASLPKPKLFGRRK